MPLPAAAPTDGGEAGLATPEQGTPPEEAAPESVLAPELLAAVAASPRTAAADAAVRGEGAVDDAGEQRGAESEAATEGADLFDSMSAWGAGLMKDASQAIEEYTEAIEEYTKEVREPAEQHTADEGAVSTETLVAAAQEVAREGRSEAEKPTVATIAEGPASGANL